MSFTALQVNFAERGEGSSDTVEFVLQAGTFPLELVNY